MHCLHSLVAPHTEYLPWDALKETVHEANILLMNFASKWRKSLCPVDKEPLRPIALDLSEELALSFSGQAAAFLQSKQQSAY